MPALAPTDRDDLVLSAGLGFRILLREGESLNRRSDRFGKNNDFIAFLPSPADPNEATLWVNHEYPIPLFDGDRVLYRAETRRQAERMMGSVGGSIVVLRRRHDGWHALRDERNRRLDANTPIPLVAPRAIGASRTALGTMGNCAGGVTPWGTVLSCEENHENYYGRWDAARGRTVAVAGGYGWERFFSRDPRHYGWVVEVNPKNGAARKLTSLGRFSHESATVVLAPDGRPVVYSGDDARGGCIFKFIADAPGELSEGRLYAANIPAGRWELLSLERPELRRHFRDQLDVLTRAREAAHRCGATGCDRPEDIEVDARTGLVYVSLTNNVKKRNYFGSILRIAEQDSDPRSAHFSCSTYLTGGVSSGFSCPDNMTFDPAGNLWLACDIAESEMNRGPYAAFKNNGLFVIPMRGPGAGRPVQVASAPRGAEFTGPCFSSDGRTLFLSVQHPGIGSTSVRMLESHWPDGGHSLPRSAVVAITGALLDEFAAG